MLSDLKHYIIEHVDATEYYKSRFPRWNPRVKSNISCVFHRKDSSPSLSINLKNGGARCFAASCGASVGNIVHFESAFRNNIQPKKVTPEQEQDAARALYGEFVRPIVSVATLQQFQSQLRTDLKQRSFLSRSTGLNSSTIDKFGIGYDTRSQRFTFPIQNQWGDVINIRFYRPKSARKAKDIKIYSLVEGKGTDAEIRFGGIELFPWQSFRTYTADKPIFFMASEKETMLANQLNLQAVCSTNGEGSWADEWLELFAGYDVGVLFDQDKGGEKGAQKIVATLQQTVTNVVALKLPFAADYRGDKDFDDWILSKTGNVFALQNLLKSEIEKKKAAAEKASLSPVETRRAKVAGDEWDVPKFFDNRIHDLGEIRTRTDTLNHCVYTRGIIAAVASKSFDVPYRFKLKTKNGIQDFTMSIGRDMVSFVGASDTDILSVLTRLVGAPVIDWKILSHIPIAEVEVVPIVDVGTESEGRYTVQRCFVLGKTIESNTPYELTVIPTTLTKSQEKILIVVSAVEVSRAIDTWNFDEKEMAAFETFRPTKEQSVGEKLEQIADEIAANHSKIYDRADWHIVALLSWLCPLAWNFPGETELQRGWLNTLAIGDTQTGKSKVVATLQRLFKLGDIVNAENCTFVGLVGGAIKTGSGQMMLRWGRIPLCDRKLVIIEELSGLSVSEISNMSEVRSRGIARLDKGGLASQTPARTRLIALSNVRPMQKNLAQYLSGVKAIQELIGHPEDISRFDLIVTLVDSEVSSDVINNPVDETTEATFTPEQLRRLCQFAWSLKPHQITFTDEAYILCLEWTKKMQDLYHPSVPIFKAASGRLLLARIGAAIATLQFSWDGQTLTIEDQHIDAAVNLLRGLYDNPSFGYLEYSRQMQDREAIKSVAELEKSVKSNVKGEILAPTFENLIHAAKFTRDELAAVGSMQLFQADDLVGHLLRSRVIRKGEANTWEITKPGMAWMKEIISKKTK
jgi:hypothetical protein